MFGFIRQNELDTLEAKLQARFETLRTTSEQSLLRSEELHEMCSRLIKRFETRQQRSKEVQEDDWPEPEVNGVDPISAAIHARRNRRRGTANGL